jgi:hypothetical protein
LTSSALILRTASSMRGLLFYHRLDGRRRFRGAAGANEL